MNLKNKVKSLISGRKSFEHDDFAGVGVAHSNISKYVSNVMDDYENAYGNISKIVQGFSTIVPKVINGDGDEIGDSHITNVLRSPNTDMSSLKFRAALSLMYITHDEVYVRVHYKGARVQSGKIKPESITGFTFIENVTPFKKDGKLYFYLQGETITDDEVITISTVNPYNLSQGYSASRAARRWARLDDYIVDYETGFFVNGAVPAGMFIITAPSVQQFKEIKKMLESQHRGATNNNKVTYSHRTIDQTTGKPNKDAQIEWIPFNITNRDLDIKNILPVINTKIDSMYGVPAEIRGELQNSNYASVTQAKGIFIDYTLRPHTLAIWDDFAHGLERITTGIGGTISFELPSPEDADQKVALTSAKKNEVETLLLLANKFTVASAVDALGLDEQYKKLKPIETQNSDNNTTEKLLTPGVKKHAKKDITEDDEDLLLAALVASFGVAVALDLLADARKAQQDLNSYLTSASDTYIKRLDGLTIPDIDIDTNEGRATLSEWVDKNLTSKSDEEAILAVLSPFILSAIRKSGVANMASLPGQLTFDPLYKKLTLWFEDRSKESAQLIKGVNDKAVLDTITKHVKVGDLDTESIAKSLREAYDFSDSRAKLIAENEVMSATRAGQYYSDLQSGLVESKVWHGTLDGRERSAHLAAEGQTVPFEDTFSVDGDELLFPTDHSNGAKASNTIRCRCNYTKVLKKDTAKKRLSCKQCKRYVGTVKSIEGTLLCKCGGETTYVD